MKLTIKVSTILEQFFLIMIIVLVFFYDAFVSILGFLDEFFALSCIVGILVYLVFRPKINLFSKEVYIFALLAITNTLGLLSNLYSYIIGYETELAAVFGDFVSFNKAFVVYFTVRILSVYYNSNGVLEKLSNYIEKIFYILVIVVVFDLLFKIFPRSDRFGMQSIELFFKHESRYAFAFSFIFLVLLPKYFPKNLGKLFLILIIGVLSLRVKFFGFIFMALIFLFFGKKLIRTPKLIFLSTMGIIVVTLVLFFWENIAMYFTFENLSKAWSRAVVLYYSFIIGYDFFPFGTGFGTFSSYYSGYYYSWVYDLYGINKVYGIRREYWNFVADQYWPMVLGQFGYLGLISMFAVIYNYAMMFFNEAKANINNQKYYTFLSIFLGVVMLLIDSTSDAIFSQQRAVAIFAYFALVMNTVNKNEGITNK